MTETLPLYGWYEDWDFSRQLASFGSIVEISNACGVHLSAKVGRITGVRTGYAQVANPIYARKGTFLCQAGQSYPMASAPHDARSMQTGKLRNPAAACTP